MLKFYSLFNKQFMRPFFSRIAAAMTSKQAWAILRTEFRGDERIVTVKLQTLQRDFETLGMTIDQFIADFMSKVMAIISHMCAYGEYIIDEIIVGKILRSLTPKFDHVVTVIEEGKDLSILTIDE